MVKHHKTVCSSKCFHVTENTFAIDKVGIEYHLWLFSWIGMKKFVVLEIISKFVLKSNGRLSTIAEPSLTQRLQQHFLCENKHGATVLTAVQYEVSGV